MCTFVDIFKIKLYVNYFKFRTVYYKCNTPTVFVVHNKI